jgi:hypothetical protein
MAERRGDRCRGRNLLLKTDHMEEAARRSAERL